MMATKKKAKKRTFRPKPDDAKVWGKLCQRLSTGESLRKICKAKDMPSLTVTLDYLHESTTTVQGQYARARQRGIEMHIDGIVDLADTANQDNAHAVRLRVDTRKWLASKILPKVYGDRIALDAPSGLNGDGEAPDLLEVSRSLIFILTAAEEQAAGQRVANLPLLTAPAPVRQAETAPTEDRPRRPVPEWLPPEDEPSDDADRHLSIAAEKDEMQRGLPIHKNIRYRGRG